MWRRKYGEKKKIKKNLLLYVSDKEVHGIHRGEEIIDEQ